MLLAELVRLDLACAPHVLARLAAALAGDTPAIIATAARLTPEERRGLRPLPSPLPAITRHPTVRDDLRAATTEDRRLLLTVALSLDEELGPVLAADGRGVADVIRGSAARHLLIHAGRIRITDPRVTNHVLSSATPAEAERTHRRLAAVHAERGDRAAAAWHRARACPVADPTVAVALIGGGRAAASAGRAERALSFAAEAAAHATGGLREEARVLAGSAALACGFAAEAADWLGALFPAAAEPRRLRALGPLLAAHAVVHGSVPIVDPRRFAPTAPPLAGDAAWLRTAGIAAILCAERGDRDRARRWLATLREAAVRTGEHGALRDAVVGLCGLLSGEIVTGGEPAPSTPLLGGAGEALHAAIAGDIDEGLRVLGSAAGSALRERDPLMPGFEGSPVARAYRAVTEVLLLVWRGDIGRAREALLAAALDVPIGIPFAGLGVVLARRLDLAVLGALGPFARSLTAVLPSSRAPDVLVDRAVEAFLDGSFEAAAGAMGLWQDRGAPHPPFAVPGLDDVLLRHGDAGPPPVRPPEADVALALRRVVARSADGGGHTDHEALSTQARGLRSPFARGRVELLLGARCALQGDVVRARVHLQQAERLFDAAGASAWERTARRRLDRLDAEGQRSTAVPEELGACRSAWAQLLTARELEVAMLAVGGTGNREIAERLSVSVRTVEVHLGRVFSKLGVRNRVELTVLAHRSERHL
ncbi:helix-turn-helix transcriptional regulator [Microbacterium sp. BLY]|uniref:helix-turn-helix transcriptional regulator n=1 Tax=Microbacterium sp. BLY TaxID=2823280 RepID=UPI001B344B9A|nr:helix-turn-helix transcriptional regulator [Microbacterium sp. BLY]MBP3978128.1 helix-turn-helix transcriptional regulator [Microbacterium sp. BLY]